MTKSRIVKKERILLEVAGLNIPFVKTARYSQFDRPFSEKKAKNYMDQLNQNVLLVNAHQFLPVVLRKQTLFKVHEELVNNKTKIILKSKVRPIAEVAHKDALIYSLYAAKLNEFYEQYVEEKKIDDVATAYRRGRGSNIEASKEVIDELQAGKNHWVIKSDFIGFFDHLNHAILKQNVSKLLSQKLLADDWYVVLKSLTKYRHIEAQSIPMDMLKYAKKNGRYVNSIRDFGEAVKKGQINVSKKHSIGIPQGTSMSAVLANVYMLHFDEEVAKKALSLGGVYRRYSDDFVVVLPGEMTKEKVEEFRGYLKELAQKMVKLELEGRKTKILFHAGDRKGILRLQSDGSFKQSTFDYLGFVFDGKTVSLRSKGMFKYSYKGKRAMRLLAYQEHELRAGKRVAVNSHANAVKYFLVPSSKIQSFRGYAGRAQRIFSTGEHEYAVKINTQVLKASVKFRKYLSEQRKK